MVKLYNVFKIINKKNNNNNGCVNIWNIAKHRQVKNIIRHIQIYLIYKFDKYRNRI